MKSNYPRAVPKEDSDQKPRVWLSALVLVALMVLTFGYRYSSNNVDGSFQAWRVRNIDGYLNPFHLVLFALAGFVFWRSALWKLRHKLLLVALSTLGFMASIFVRVSAEIPPLDLLSTRFGPILEESALLFLGLIVVATPVWIVAAALQKLSRRQMVKHEVRLVSLEHVEESPERIGSGVREYDAAVLEQSR